MRDRRAPKPKTVATTGALPNHLFQRSIAHTAASLRALSPESRVESESAVSGSRKRSRRKSVDAELPQIGAIIDKYRIEELLGVGGFAAVYRATHMLLNAPMAIKLLRPKVLQKKPHLAGLLCEEARLAARIQHPNVVRVHDVTHSQSITYIVMEYIEGKTLADVIRDKGALSTDDVIRIGIELASGLKAGLAQGVLHRDIKPANILLAKNGGTKIVDLGLAELHTGNPTSESLLASKTHIVGTLGYMAPELASQPEAIDFRADIYSLGVTLYEAALGHPPFPTRDAERCMRMHATQPVPHPQMFNARFPRPLGRVLLWMLEKNPAERPDSYDALIEGLANAHNAMASGTR